MGSKDILKAGLGVGFALAAAGPAWAVPTDFASKADALLKSSYAADAPGVAVIVVDDGKVAYASGRGMADLEAKRAITPATVFRLGSITKQFTAAVILQLADEGKLSLSDPLSKFLPDYPKPGADATIAQLLNHTSGIKSYTALPGWMGGESVERAYTTEQLIAEFKDEPADFAAGTQHQYNNSGYVLLGAVIEKVTRKPWHAAIDERIARPLNLRTIRYGELESSTADMAAGYTAADGRTAPARKIHMSVPHAAGALIGSVEDLARWAEALHKGKLVSADRYRQMVAPTRLPDGKVEDYGFGLGRGKMRGRDMIRHGGGIFGFNTASAYFPDDDVFVAVFANSDEAEIGPGLTLMKLAAMAVGDPFPQFSAAEVPEAEIEPLLGLYEFEGGSRRFFRKDGRLFTRLAGGRDLEVSPTGKDRFFYGPASLSWFEVKRGADGKHVMEMHIEEAGEVLTSVRTGPVPADAPEVDVARAVLERYAGSYTAKQGIAKVALTGDGALTLQLGRGEPRRLLAISESEFRPEGMDGNVVFHPGASGISHLIVTQGKNEIRADREPAGS